MSRPTRRRVLRTTGATLATVGTAGLVSTSASAQSGDTPDTGVLAEGFEVETDHQAFVEGFLTGLGDRFARYDAVKELAGHARNEFNANTDGWLSYGNWLLDEAGLGARGSTVVNVDFGVSRIPFREPTNLVETHIAAEYDEAADEFVGLEWAEDFRDDAHYQVGLRNQAVRKAGDELLAFRERYIGDDRDGHEIPDAEWLNQLAGEHAASLRLGENSMSILDVLLGGPNGV